MSIGAAAALAALQAPASFADSVTGCSARLCFAQNLQPFFSRLRAARAGSGRIVHIIQIGDSHTAGDMITNGARQPLVARFGNGGRGVL
ncbi:MAG: hypothetical protein JO157_03065, partial [Acetobacteraceae bacterium]|nr:hypothetical protein [Acetobacteraceae bacterium]